MGSFRELPVPDEVSNMEEHFRKTLEGDAQRFKTSITSKSGERAEPDITTVPDMENGKITGLHGIAKDIIERKRAEKALKKSSHHLRLIP